MKFKISSEKKGQVSPWKVVIAILVVIIGIIIGIVFYQRAHISQLGNAESCHTSVVFQATGKGIGNLDCQTDYVCISGGGKCSNMDATITVSVDPSNKTQILKAIANQLANCWYTYGEGKLDYVGISQGFKGGTQCAVCSIIGFDSSVQKSLNATQLLPAGASCQSNTQCVGGNCDSNLHVCIGGSTNPLANYPLTYKDLIDYLMSGKLTEDNQLQTYLYYLYGVSTPEQLFEHDSQSSKFESLYNSTPISLNDQYAIITGEGKSLVWGAFGSNFIHPILLNTNNVSSANLGCANYITTS